MIECANYGCPVIPLQWNSWQNDWLAPKLLQSAEIQFEASPNIHVLLG